MSNTVKIPYFKPETIVSIDVSGSFLSRLYDLLFIYLKENDISIDELKKKINDVESNDDKLYNAITILILISEIENKIKSEGLVEYEEVSLDDNQD